MTSDEATFTAVFDAHRDAILGFLITRTSDRDAAQDLLQETFLRAWRRIGEVSAMDNDRQRAWLVTVARNLVTDRYRSEASRTAALERVEHDTSDADPTPGPEEHATSREQLAQLDAAIRRLPEDQRTILAMATLGGLTSGEIGAALDQPAGTVRYKLHRAREELGRELTTEGSR